MHGSRDLIDRSCPTSGSPSNVPQRLHPRSVLLGVALMGALLLGACAPVVPPPRALVAADHRAGTVADEVDVAYGPYDDQVLDVYRTTAPTRRGTIVFVHGGDLYVAGRAEYGAEEASEDSC